MLTKIGLNFFWAILPLHTATLIEWTRLVVLIWQMLGHDATLINQVAKDHLFKSLINELDVNFASHIQLWVVLWLMNNHAVREFINNFLLLFH